MDEYVRQAGATLRDAGRSISKPGFPSSLAPSMAGANGIGSTQQRWMDYDSAKAAELALRTVLGAPSSTELRSPRPSYSGHHAPYSGYLTPMTSLLGTSLMLPGEAGPRTSGTVSPRLWAQASRNTRPGSGLPSGAMSPAVIEPLRDSGHAVMHMAPVPENRTGAPVQQAAGCKGTQTDTSRSLTLEGVKKLLSAQEPMKHKRQENISAALDTHAIAREMVRTGVARKPRRRQVWKFVRRITLVLVTGAVVGAAVVKHQSRGQKVEDN